MSNQTFTIQPAEPQPSAADQVADAIIARLSQQQQQQQPNPVDQIADAVIARLSQAQGQQQSQQPQQGDGQAQGQQQPNPVDQIAEAVIARLSQAQGQQQQQSQQSQQSQQGDGQQQQQQQSQQSQQGDGQQDQQSDGPQQTPLASLLAGLGGSAPADIDKLSDDDFLRNLNAELAGAKASGATFDLTALNGAPSASPAAV